MFRLVLFAWGNACGIVETSQIYWDLKNRASFVCYQRALFSPISAEASLVRSPVRAAPTH